MRTRAASIARRKLIAGLVVVGSALGMLGMLGVNPAPAFAASPSPIQPGNRPTGIAGQQNGLVDPGALVTVESGCRLARAAAPSFVHLLAAARADGVNLGMESCYRPLADQKAVRGNACGNGNCACAATISQNATVGTSFHGWGKAVDFSVDGHSLTDPFSPAERWLNAHAGTYGWNHPAFALLGTACPEAWHWEWVGDGGELHAGTIKADVMGGVGGSGGSFATITGLGAVTWFAAPGVGSLEPQPPLSPLAWVVVGGALTHTGRGLWRVAADGGVFSSGDASFYGSTGAIHLNRPIVGMAATRTGHGYWLVASDGGIFSFGDAAFFGSTGAMHLNRPIVGMAATPTGHGYWLVASDGGIFSFGDARFFGSTGAIHLNSPVVGMASTPDGDGYWLGAADGGIFSYGDAAFNGSAVGTLTSPVVGIVRRGGDTYSVVAANGTIRTFPGTL
jgi:D-alanyl-D-alanine carboxypeptidase